MAVFAVLCYEEHLVLSSKMEEKAWCAIETVALELNSSLPKESQQAMFGWKGMRHLADAKETYAWRRTIDAIKESDLARQAQDCSGVTEEVRSLIKSKPIMLKMSGEITNALIHSHQNRHRISFSQIDSVEPSGRAT